MSFPNQAPHSGPAGAPPNTAASFNAMLQRSRQEQAPQEQTPEAPGYGGVYNAPSPQPFAQQNVLGGGRPPQQQQILPLDLPPQAFLTSAMLLDMVDKKVCVLLRDEKEYIGILRSYDQFANLVLTECYERIAARNPEATSDNPTTPKWLACDVKCPGVMTVRGENVTICATVDLDREDDPKGIKFAPADTVRALADEQRAQKAAFDNRRNKALKAAGIEPNFGMQA